MATVHRTDTTHVPSRAGGENLDRLPPHNLDAEKGVLGSLLLDPHMCDEVAMVIRAEDFYADAHQKLFTHLIALHEADKRIDATLLVERLKQAGDFEAIGGAPYIAEVAQSVPFAANAVHYAEIVRDKATLRALIHAGTEILRDVYDSSADPAEIVSQSEQKIFAVHDARSPEQVTNAHDLMVEAFDRIDARLDGSEAGGIPTGYTDLDNMTGGLHNSELVVLASRPSMGKTALATNMAEYITMEVNVPTLFVSLEMARLELAQRMLCSQGRIDANKFRKGFISSDDRQNLVEASSKLSQAPLFIDDSPFRTVTQIAASARRLKRKQDLGLIVIDYLQLIHPDDPRDPRQEQVAKMARRLKGLARELRIPVLCVAQLNRQVEASRENRPRLSQLRESGAIEQDADVVMFIHREEYYHTPEEAEERGIIGQADLIVAKQRNGPTGDVKLFWHSQFTRFENASQKPYEDFEQYDDGTTEFDPGHL